MDLIDLILHVPLIQKLLDRLVSLTFRTCLIICSTTFNYTKTSASLQGQSSTNIISRMQEHFVVSPARGIFEIRCISSTLESSSWGISTLIIRHELLAPPRCQSSSQQRKLGESLRQQESPRKSAPRAPLLAAGTLEALL